MIWVLSLIFGACSQNFSLTKSPLDTNIYQISLSGDATTVNITKLEKLKQEQFSWWNPKLLNNEIHAPWLSSWSSLKEVGEVYKHLYEDIYILKDWRDYEIKRREGYEKSPDHELSRKLQKEWNSFLSYIKKLLNSDGSQ